MQPIVTPTKNKRSETPLVFLGSLSFPTHRTSLNTARQAVMDDVGAVEILKYNYFKKHCMPQSVTVTQKHVATIKSKLIEEQAIDVLTETDGKGKPKTVYRWQSYPKPPSQHAANENECFNGFGTIYSTVSRIAREVITKRNPKDGPPAITRLSSTGKQNLKTNVSNSSKCDAALIVEDDTIAIEDPEKVFLDPDQPAANSSNDAIKDAIVKTSDMLNSLSLEKPESDLKAEVESLKRTVDSLKEAVSLPSSFTAGEAATDERSFDDSGDDDDDNEEEEEEDDDDEDPEKWHNLAVIWEYKKKMGSDDQKDNIEKSVWNGNHSLRNDPCRRSTFGGMVNDTMLHLWKFSRAGVVVSEGVDWFSDVDKLIEIFAMFALASKTELGWDPTVQRVTVGNYMHYMYTIKGKEYVTYKKPLCDYRADVLLGRGTRVYTVYERGTDPRNIENLFALKDLWLREGDTLEGIILREILEKIDDDLKKYFLTPLDSFYVEVYSVKKKKFVIDSTHLALSTVPGNKEFLQRDQAPQSNLKTDPASLHTYSRGLVPSIDESRFSTIQQLVLKRSRISHRDHSRTLFKEVCETLHEVYNVSTFFRGIVDASRALQAIHKLGYVHRDVSTGNVLWCPHEGVAKLSDLEYRKSLTAKSVHEDFRTGTFQFMSMEVYNQEVVMDNVDVDEDDVSLREVLDAEYNSESEDYKKRQKYLERGKKPAESSSNNAKPQKPDASKFKSVAAKKVRPPFRYTVLHDFESLFWMSLWGLVHHFPDELIESSTLSEELIKQIQDAAEVFPSSPTFFPTIRCWIITKPGLLEKILGHLPIIYADASVELLEMRNILRSHYLDYYASVKQDTSLIYIADTDKFYRKFRHCARRIVDNDLYDFKTVFITDTVLKIYEKETGKKIPSAIPNKKRERKSGGPAGRDSKGKNKSKDAKPGSVASEKVLQQASIQKSKKGGSSKAVGATNTVT